MAVLVVLGGCSAQTKVDKIESIKASDVSEFPKIISVVEQSGVDFDEKMKRLIVDQSAACGVSMKFYYFNNYKSDDFYDKSQAIMWIKALNSDTTTKESLAYKSSYLSRVTYEFTVEEKKTQKNVWRARMDFFQADPRDNFDNGMRGEQKPSVVWSSALIGQMKKDGILTSCH